MQGADPARFQMIEQPGDNAFTLLDGNVLENDDRVDEIVLFVQSVLQFVCQMEMGLVSPKPARVLLATSII